MKTYFESKCENIVDGNPKQFWHIIKPFISDKGSNGNANIMLMENDCVVNDPKTVCNIFNEYFTNVTDAIGAEKIVTEDEMLDDIIDMYKEHDSI